MTVFAYERYLFGKPPDAIKVVELLLSHGADVNVVNKEGRTPLDETTGKLGRLDIAETASFPSTRQIGQG